MAFFALIPAAGIGSRFSQGGVPKQYSTLAGRSVLWHAIRSVCIEPVEAVFVVLSPGDLRFAQEDWSAFGARIEPLYCGGASRRDSVYNGLVAMMSAVDADDWVLVHDAARPCLPASALSRLIMSCGGDAVGGILAMPVADTVKRAAKEDAACGGARRIAGTEDRSGLWLAQTPQMFRAGALAEALRRAGDAVTDEAGALEAIGLSPRLVTGSAENLKVTWPEDLAIAAAILDARAGRLATEAS